MKKYKHFWVLFLCLTLILPFASGLSFSEDNIEAQLDEAIQYEEVNYSVPGIMVAIVEDGKIVYNYTNGVSDTVLRKPLSSDSTLIQTGSMAKLVTTLALLDILHQKNISLDDKVSQYLVLENLDPEITIRQILTHTSGIPTIRYHTAQEESPLDQDGRGTFSENASDYMELYNHKPVTPVGEYTNYAVTNSVVAGMLIEALTNDSYESVVSDYIAKHYNMLESSKVIEGDSEGLDLARGYSVYGGGQTLLPPYRTLLLSSEDFVTTGKDMTLLLKGITSENKTDSDLFTRQVSAYGNQFGRSLAFSIMTLDHREIYLQDGAIPGEMTRLMVEPNSRTGIFIWYNSDDSELRKVLSRKILDIYLGDRFKNQSPVVIPFKQELKDNYGNLIGAYVSTNITPETVEKVSRITNQLRVSIVDEGLKINNETYSYIGDDTFYNEINQDYAKFIFNEAGRLQYLTINNAVYERGRLYESFLVEIPMIGLVLVVNLLILLLMLSRWKQYLVNRIHRTPRMVLLIATVIALILIGLIVVIAKSNNVWNIVYGIKRSLLWIKVLGLISLVWSVPSFFMLNRAKSDFRWTGGTIFLFRLQWLLNIFMVIWLWRYHFI